MGAAGERGRWRGCGGWPAVGAGWNCPAVPAFRPKCGWSNSKNGRNGDQEQQERQEYREDSRIRLLS